MRSLVAAALLFALPLCALSQTQPSRVDAAKKAIREKMRDPGSTRFRNVRLLKSGQVCAEVSGRNAFGGYADFELVAVSTKGLVWFIDRPPLPSYDDWPQAVASAPISQLDRWQRVLDLHEQLALPCLSEAGAEEEWRFINRRRGDLNAATPPRPKGF